MGHGALRCSNHGTDSMRPSLSRAMRLEHFSYLCRVQRGPGGPRDSRPGGRRYLFFQRPATLSQAGVQLYTKRALEPIASIKKAD
jgi:hypothetical protein